MHVWALGLCESPAAPKEGGPPQRGPAQEGPAEAAEGFPRRGGLTGKEGRAEDGPGERGSGAPTNKRNHHTLTSEKWPEQPNL